MKGIHTLGIVLSISTASLFGQEMTKKEADIQAIKDMCGCYEVSFKYTETFAPDTAYTKKEDYSATALEWAGLVEESDNKLSIQHILLVRDTMVIKHWRQDWLYENTALFSYYKDNSWDFENISQDNVKGQWTQKVYQVDDSPRYSGTASWIHADGKHFWEDVADAPLPRREYSKRSDYNVMRRGNRHEITDYGWVHEQDNDKITRGDAGEDTLLAQEKGYNVYTKVADEKCALASNWWEDNKLFWTEVKAAWDEVYATNGRLQLLKKVDDKPFYKHLAKLEEAGADRNEISTLIQKFIVSTAPKQMEGK